MNNYLSFFVKAIITGVIAIQATAAETSYQLISNSIADPIYLSICGFGLLYLGLYKKSTEK